MATVPDTTVTAEHMAQFLSANASSAVTADVQRYYDGAVALVADAFVSAFRDVPVHVVNECVFRAGRGLKDATKLASSGAGQVTVTDGTPLRAPADPLVACYPLIRRYVVMGI